jgi:hypothetical protein
MRKLQTAWMNGLQFYLRQRSDIFDGIGVCADSPWTITFIPQGQFWAADFAHVYGDGIDVRRGRVAGAQVRTR